MKFAEQVKISFKYLLNVHNRNSFIQANDEGQQAVILIRTKSF